MLGNPESAKNGFGVNTNNPHGPTKSKTKSTDTKHPRGLQFLDNSWATLSKICLIHQDLLMFSHFVKITTFCQDFSTGKSQNKKHKITS